MAHRLTIVFTAGAWFSTIRKAKDSEFEIDKPKMKLEKTGRVQEC